MAKRRWKRMLSLMLSAAMVWSMSGMPAFASDDPVPPADDPPGMETELTPPSGPNTDPGSGGTGKVEENTCTCDPKVEGETGHTNSKCPFYTPGEIEEKTCTCDPKVEGETGHTDPECPFYTPGEIEEKTCTCDPKVEGETGHTNPECPFYTPGEIEEKTCTCDPKVEGETGHTNPECPFYQTDEVPTESEEAKALIEKLSSLEEFHQWKPSLEIGEEEEGYKEAYDAAVAAHRTEMEEQVKAARVAYDAMSKEQKDAFAPELLQKLTAWETKLSQPVTDMEGRLSGLPSVEEFQNWKPTLTIPETDPGYQAAYDAAVAAHRTEVEEQVKLVREAYDALNDAQRAVLDPALVEKLTALEALLLPALMPVADPKAVYVSSSGSDDDNQGNGSKEKPYATLAKAVEKVENGGTIYLLSNLTSLKCARFYNKSITIDGGGNTVYRGDSFEPQSDTNRSWYNPGLIEICSDDSSQSGFVLRLQNITLDDSGKHAGSIFHVQNDGENSNTELVQDAIVASYTDRCTIVLGSGATLANYGGMSAVRVNSGGKVIMESGSVITDTTHTRTEGAAAIHCEGGVIEMQQGASVSNVSGRAVMLEYGGKATLNGSISNISMTAGGMRKGYEGIAVYLTQESEAVLGPTGKIAGVTSNSEPGNGSAAITTYGSNFTADSGSEISNVNDIKLLWMDDYGHDYGHKVSLNGLITDCSNKKGIIISSWYGHIELGPEGIIQRCSADTGIGILYSNNGTRYSFYGKIIDNNANALYLANQSGARPEATMYDGALIARNKGYGLYLNNGCLFTMEGGEISENTSHGVYVREKNETFIMNGGVIRDNGGFGIYLMPTYISFLGKVGDPLADITGGQILGNKSGDINISDSGGRASDEKSRVMVAGGVLQGERVIKTNFGTLTLDDHHPAAGFGTAKPAAKSELVKQVQSKNSNYTFVGSVALWFKPGQETFHFTMPRHYSVKDGQSLYWGIMPLDANGNPAAGATATVEKVTNAATLSIELKNLKPNQPYAVALFTKKAVNIVPADIIIYMGGTDGADGTIDNENGHIQGSKTLPEPGFRVTLPKELNGVAVTNLKLQYKEDNGNILTWKFEKYGQGEHDVYRIAQEDGTPGRAVRMKFTKKDGTIITEDNFIAGKNLNQTLTMEIYGDGIEAGKVSIVYGNQNFEVDTDSAEITVLGTTTKEQYGNLGEKASSGKPGLTAPDGTTFTVNDSSVQVNKTEGIALLFDGIIEETTSESNRSQLIQKRADQEINQPVAEGMTRYYDLKYLDLVDRNNGNAWVTASKDVTISWPYPSGATKDDEFTLLHFQGLHRDMTSDEVAGDIASCKVETITITEKTDTHITFQVGSGGFSPFALVWESKTPPTPGPDEPGNGGSGRPGSGSSGSSTYDPQAKDPDRAQVSLEARKLLDGKIPGRQEFTFTLTDEKGKVVRTAENKGGKIVFDSLALLPGTYRYTMEEVDGSAGSAFGYDDTVYEAEVFVYTSGGKYTAMVSYYQDGKELDELPTFRNTTAPAAPGTNKENPITGGGPAFPAALTAAVSLGAVALLWRKRS